MSEDKITRVAAPHRVTIWVTIPEEVPGKEFLKVEVQDDDGVILPVKLGRWVGGVGEYTTNFELAAGSSYSVFYRYKDIDPVMDSLEAVASMITGAGVIPMGYGPLDSLRDAIKAEREGREPANVERSELKRVREKLWKLEELWEAEVGEWDPEKYVPSRTPEEIRAAGHAWAKERAALIRKDAKVEPEVKNPYRPMRWNGDPKRVDHWYWSLHHANWYWHKGLEDMGIGSSQVFSLSPEDRKPEPLTSTEDLDEVTELPELPDEVKDPVMRVVKILRIWFGKASPKVSHWCQSGGDWLYHKGYRIYEGNIFSLNSVDHKPGPIIPGDMIEAVDSLKGLS